MVAGWGILVFVPVIAVLCMAVTVVDVIHMVTVGYGHVATVGAVLMIVVFVNLVGGVLALIPMAFVFAVEVAIVNVVNVVAVGYGHVATVGAVLMIVVGVSSAAHGSLLSGRESIG